MAQREVSGVTVKIGEDKSEISAGEKYFFAGEQPGKDLHHLHRGLDTPFHGYSTNEKTVFFADRYTESEEK